MALGEAGDEQSIINTTIAGNQAVSPVIARGGGLEHNNSAKDTALQVLNATIVGNSASSPSGSATGGNVSDISTGGGTILHNSILAAGSAEDEGPNCLGAVKSAGHNMDSSAKCGFAEPGDKSGLDPLLDPLADNGGPTQTMALRPGSPAIDAAGEPCPATDQRGVPRPQGPACDIGAYEVAVPPASTGGAAKLRLLRKRVLIGAKTGKGRLRARCLNVTGDLCTVRLRLWLTPPKLANSTASKRRRVKAGTVTGTIAGNHNGALRVKLTKRARSLLAASPTTKLRVTALGTSKNRASDPTKIKTKLLLKLKPKRRR